MKKLVALFLAIFMVAGMTTVLASAEENPVQLYKSSYFSDAQISDAANAISDAKSTKHGLLSATYNLAFPFDNLTEFTTSSSTTTINKKVVYYDDYQFAMAKNDVAAFIMVSEFPCKYQILDKNKKFLDETTESDLEYDSTFGLYILAMQTFPFQTAGTYYLRATQMTKTRGWYAVEGHRFPRTIKISPSSVSLKSGESYTPSYSITPGDASPIYSMKSSNTSVATVDEEGTIRAINPGTAVITAYTDTTKATITVKVTQPVKSISFNKTSVEIYQGRSYDLGMTISPSNATNKTVTWSSKDDNIAYGVNGVVVGKSLGTTTVTATSADGPSASVSVTVLPITSEMVDINRLSGRTRYATAISICDEGWETAETVLLANGLNYADALSGVSLAYQLDAPLLLTEGKTLESNVSEKIKALGATNIIILGGNLAVSTNLENTLKQQYDVERIKGNTRYATSVAIADYIVSLNNNVKPDTAFIVTGDGYADALSISPYAAMKGYPVIYAKKGHGIQPEAAAYLSEGVTNVVILGGENAVEAATVNQIAALGISTDNISRIRGRSRLDTSMAIVETYKQAFGNNVMIATGMNFPDALAGGVLAAKNKAPMILVGSTANPASAVIDSAKTYISECGADTVYILGGEKIVPTSWISNITDK